MIQVFNFQTMQIQTTYITVILTEMLMLLPPVLMKMVSPQNLELLILFLNIALLGIMLIIDGIHMIKKEIIQLLLLIKKQHFGTMVIQMFSLVNMIMIMVMF